MKNALKLIIEAIRVAMDKVESKLPKRELLFEFTEEDFLIDGVSQRSDEELVMVFIVKSISEDLAEELYGCDFEIEASMVVIDVDNKRFGKVACKGGFTEKSEFDEMKMHWTFLEGSNGLMAGTGFGTVDFYVYKNYNYDNDEKEIGTHQIVIGTTCYEVEYLRIYKVSK